MSRSALAAALKDFGAGPPRPAAEPFRVAAMGAPPPPIDLPGFPPEPEVEPIDVDAIVAEAVAAAEAALAQRLCDEHAEALRAEQERHAEEVAALEGRFADAASVTIRDRFAEMEGRVVELTSAVTARILGTTLTDDIRDRSIERLAALIREALMDGEAVRIRIHGSLPLFETLKEKLPERGAQLDFMERPEFDLSVSIDDSVYETRLAEWSAALAETLE
jgi:hypothetical protein